jgi:lactate dehydrogenase-like 2-hydroxyacid dehydrogenase
MRIGIIGAGNIGGTLARRLQPLLALSSTLLARIVTPMVMGHLSP